MIFEWSSGCLACHVSRTRLHHPVDGRHPVMVFDTVAVAFVRWSKSLEDMSRPPGLKCLEYLHTVGLLLTHRFRFSSSFDVINAIWLCWFIQNPRFFYFFCFLKSRGSDRLFSVLFGVRLDRETLGHSEVIPHYQQIEHLWMFLTLIKLDNALSGVRTVYHGWISYNLIQQDGLVPCLIKGRNILCDLIHKKGLLVSGLAIRYKALLISFVVDSLDWIFRLVNLHSKSLEVRGGASSLFNVCKPTDQLVVWRNTGDALSDASLGKALEFAGIVLCERCIIWFLLRCCILLDFIVETHYLGPNW